MRARIWTYFVVVCVLSPLLGACATSGGKQSAGALDDAPVVSPREAELREIVARRVQGLNESGAASRSRLLRRKPYFYKEYAEYPSGGSEMALSVNESDSRTAPYWAEVRLEKVRYATSFARNRGEARSNSDFVRATGVETTSYQLRNGKWVLVGSLFVAEKREQLLDGQWQPVQESSRSSLFTEDTDAPQGNWFSRGWRRLRGQG